MDKLIHLKDLVVSDHIPILLEYIKYLKPSKILVVGPNRNQVTKKLLEKRYKRCHRSTLGRDLKFTSQGPRTLEVASSVFIVNTLAVQSRTCEEVRSLFEDPTTTVICLVKSPTDLRPESRKYVDEVIVAGKLSRRDQDKLNLCYHNKLKNVRYC